jgi:1-deoxy-D-xylulose-5-phosphate synthase
VTAQEKYPILHQIEFPADMRNNFNVDDLEAVSDELRRYIVEMVSTMKSAHLSASLGVVELTVALHYAYQTPDDKLVWDVGHQAYGHKILTGRREAFHTNRKLGGLSGFPNRAESEYDAFGVGHSSTSISAALGMAIADRYAGRNDRHHIAVVGDGAMTAGLAFEALNHSGVEDANLLVILNDNGMSIDPNVGALNKNLDQIISSVKGNTKPLSFWKALQHAHKESQNPKELVRKVNEQLVPSVPEESNFFESLNFQYFGPVDGHDVAGLVRVLEKLKTIPGPKVLHCKTVKGKGYQPAEDGDKVLWHAPGLFNKDTGEIIKVAPKSAQPPKYQDVFGHTIVELAERNPKIMGITPAMPTGSSLNIMMKAMPDRTFDVGIAEQHAVTFSAGLATQGLIPFCNIYSTFMQRAYDQLIHDVALQNLHVVFCLDRAGIAGADGATHHGAYDLAYLRCIPNMTVASAMNEEELRNLMYTAQLEGNGPFAIRYPRGRGVMTKWKTALREIKVGTGRKLRNGSDIAILSIGPLGNEVEAACLELIEDGIHAAHYDLRFAKPLDQMLLHEVFGKFTKVVTIEDGCIAGGVGSALLEFMAEHGYMAQVKLLGLPDQFIEHGTQSELLAMLELDAQGIGRAVREVLAAKKSAQQLERS